MDKKRNQKGIPIEKVSPNRMQKKQPHESYVTICDANIVRTFINSIQMLDLTLQRTQWQSVGLKKEKQVCWRATLLFHSQTDPWDAAVCSLISYHLFCFPSAFHSRHRFRCCCCFFFNLLDVQCQKRNSMGLVCPKKKNGTTNKFMKQ